MPSLNQSDIKQVLRGSLLSQAHMDLDDPETFPQVQSRSGFLASLVERLLCLVSQKHPFVCEVP